MVAEKKPKPKSRWSNDYGGKRLRNLKSLFLVANILEEYESKNRNGWIRVEEVARFYRGSVGPISDRTVYRYTNVLYQVGVVEKQKHGKVFKYKFVGYPRPTGTLTNV